MHATDVIRSFGLSVTTSEEGLNKTKGAMDRMEAATQEMDSQLARKFSGETAWETSVVVFDSIVGTAGYAAIVCEREAITIGY